MTKEECEIETSKAIMEMRKRIAELEAQIEKMKCDVNINIKFAQQTKNWLMESKLVSMILQWEDKRK